MTFLDILRELAEGAGFTILVTLSCTGAALAIGLAAALLSRLPFKPLRFAIAAFAYVFRAVPVLVLLFLVFFGLPSLGLRVPPLLAMVLSLGTVSGAYLAEIFRGAMNAVDPEEMLAAEAMGMSRLQAFRHVMVPQMLRIAAPGMINEFTTILKYTPFAFTVGIPEIMKEAMTLSAVTLRGLEIYLAVGILYFAIYRAFLALFRLLEGRYRVPGLAGQ